MKKTGEQILRTLGLEGVLKISDPMFATIAELPQCGQMTIDDRAVLQGEVETGTGA